MIDMTGLLGKPYSLHGRGPDSYDCYGAVIELERRLGHRMPDIYREYTENNERDLSDNAYNIVKGSGLVRGSRLELGNVLLFYDQKGRCCHIGVCLEDGDYFHCDMDGCQVSRLEDSGRKWEVYEWLR